MSLVSQKNIGRFKYRIKEAISYFFGVVRPAPKGVVRVIIFAQGRTGSTLLESLLCSTGYFCENGELLNPSGGEAIFPLWFVDGFSKWKSREHVVFHVKIYHLTEHRNRPVEPISFVETLHRQGWKVIYIRRRNKVKQSVSNLVAKKRGSYNPALKGDGKKEDIKISVDYKEMRRMVRRRTQYDADEDKVLENIRYHKVVYEDDLEDSSKQQETVDKILDYLGLAHRPVTTPYKKVVRMPLDELIINYEEFSEKMAEDGWQAFID